MPGFSNTVHFTVKWEKEHMPASYSSLVKLILILTEFSPLKKNEKSWTCNSVAEYLPSMYKALGSTFSIGAKKAFMDKKRTEIMISKLKK